MTSEKKKFSIKNYVWAPKLEDATVGEFNGGQASNAIEITAPPTVIEPDLSLPTDHEQDFLRSISAPSSALTCVRDGPSLSPHGNLGNPFALLQEEARSTCPADLLDKASRQFFLDVQQIQETMQARERDGRELREMLGLAEGDNVLHAVQDLVRKVTSQAAELDLVQRDLELECHLNIPLRTLVVKAEEKVIEMSTAMQDLGIMANQLQISVDEKDERLRHAISELEAERQKVASLLRIGAFLK